MKRLACLVLVCVVSSKSYAEVCASLQGDLDKLACYDRDAFGDFERNGRRNPCLSVSGGAARLACFEKSALPVADADPPPAPRDPPAALVSAATPAAARSHFRFSAGGGYSIGDHHGTFSSRSQIVDADAIGGGSGSMLQANLWWDDALFQDVGLTLGYFHLRDQGTLSIDFPKGISILTDPTTAGIKVSGVADMAFLGVVYRPSIDAPLQPFIGAGPAVGRGTARAELGLDNPFIGSFGKIFEASSVIGGTEAIMGIDVDLTDSLYLSLSPKVLWLTGRPLGVSHSYLVTMVTSEVGVRF